MRALSLLLVGSLFFSCGDDGGAGGKGNLKGTIKDKSGAPIGDAEVKSGAQTAKADFNGQYELKDLPAGAATVSVSAGWFQTKQAQATVPSGSTATLDVQLDEMPLKIDPADQTLVDTFNKTFDWSKSALYMAIMPAPTRRHLDNAIYFHNPALYKDTSSVAPVTPSPQPTIDSGGAKNFNFTLSGTSDQAFVATSIVDTFAKTGLAAELASDYMLWTPMVAWLSESKRGLDSATLNKLRVIGSAVTLQTWGGNAPKPQQIESVYISGSDVWVKVVFENFVQLGAGIADDDGDGRKEVYAKIDPKNFPSSALDLLQTKYVKPDLGTLELKAELNEALNALYSSTNLIIIKTIGQPFDTGQGTINYPFVAHEQSGQKGKVKGVILAGGAK